MLGGSEPQPVAAFIGGAAPGGPGLGLGRVRKEPLPESGPFPDPPDGEAPDRSPQEGHVIGDQQKTQGQHPQAQKRQDREDAAEHEEYSHWNANPSGIRVAQASEDTRHLARHLVFELPERPSQNSPAVACRHIL